MGVLEGCRARLGATPRSFPPEVRREARARYNPILSTFPLDSLMKVFFAQSRLLEQGRVVWACLLQANELLFAPGLNGESHAATVLHSGEDLDDPAPLQKVAARFGSLDDAPLSAPERKAAAALLHPSRRKYWQPVPPALTEGREVFASDLLVFRRLLPPEPKGATLRKPSFPLLVAPDRAGPVLQVPARFWPEEFVEFWESKSATRPHQS